MCRLLRGLLCHFLLWKSELLFNLFLLFLRYLLGFFLVAVVAEWKFVLLLRFCEYLQAKLLLNLLLFLFLRYLLVFVVVVIAIKILVSFFIFAKFADFLFRAFFTFFVTSRNFCLRCYSCDIYQGVFFFAMKFLVTFAIFADLFIFLQAISIWHVFAKIVTAFNLCWICYSCYICYFFCTFLTAVFFYIFLSKLRKQLASKFLRQCLIIDISGEPQVSIMQLFNFNGTKNNTIVGEMYNCQEFSQPLECLYQAMQTQEKSFLLLL